MRYVVAGVLMLQCVAGVLRAETIRIVGSDTLLILNQELARAYMKANPGVTVDVKGGGSGRGIKALLAAEADVAASSRLMRDIEEAAFKAKLAGRRPWRIVVAMDGLGIYVHNSNPISQLTMEQVEGMFTGRITNWKELGWANRPISVYTRDRESGTRAFVEEKVMKGKPWVGNVTEVASTAMMNGVVSRNPNAIGYGGIAYAPGAHIVKIAPREGEDAVWPSSETVMSGSYPLSRPLQLYVVPGTISPATERFVRWVLQEDAQQLVEAVGYYPMQPSEAPLDLQHASVSVTPQNMAKHGFAIKVDFDADDAEGRKAAKDYVSVTLEFLPASQAMEHVDGVVLAVGNELRAPLRTTRDTRTGRITKVTFGVRAALLSYTSLVLEPGDETSSDRRFVIPLRAFNVAD